jgi:hypothetical protein
MSLLRWKQKLLPLGMGNPQGGGKGGGGGAPTQTTSTAYQTSIPEYAQPYVETMLGATQKQLFNMDDSGNITGFQPYKPYSTNPQDYVAGFSPMQQQAQRGISNLTLPGTYGAGADISGAAAMQGMGLAGQQANAGNRLEAQSTNPYAVGAYMNPYIQNALNPALQLSNQQYGIQGANMAGQATQAGAFGGSRNALQQSLNQQNQMLANNQLIGNAYNQAYGQALGQMNQVAQTGLAGQSAAQQGLGQAASSAGQMASIGGQGLQAQQGIYGLQQQAGAQQQAQQQQMINQAISDYANAQQYPLMQLGVMSNMLRGLPMQAATTNQYVAAPNPVTQGIGLAGAGASIYNALGGGKPAGQKEGGIVGMAKGGIAGYNVGGNIKSDLYQMDPSEISEYIKTSSSPAAKKMAEEVLRDKVGRAGGGIIAFGGGSNSTVGDDVRVYNDARQAAADARAASTPRTTLSREDANYIPPELDANVAKQNEIPPNLQFNPSAVQRESVNFIPESLRPEADKEAAVNRAAAIAQGAVPKPRQMGLSSKDMTDAERIAGFKAALEGKAPAPVAAPAQTPNAELPPAPTNVKVDKLGRADAAIQDRKGIVQAAPEGTSSGTGIKPPGTLMPTSGLKGGVSPGNGINLAPPVNPDAGKSTMDFIKEKEAYMGPNLGVQKERSNLMAEKANAADEARRTTALRMAEFFGAWGSTPGNTIVAGLNTLKNKIPDFITDMKEASKIRRQIDKDISELDKIERLEKAGNWDEARKLKSDLSKEARETWGVLYKGAVDMYQSDQQLKGMLAKAGAEGKTADVLRAQAMQQQLDKSISEVKNNPNSQYNANRNIIQNMTDKEGKLKKAETPAMQAKLDAAVAQVKEQDTKWKTQENQINSLLGNIDKKGLTTSGGKEQVRTYNKDTGQLE